MDFDRWMKAQSELSNKSKRTDREEFIREYQTKPSGPEEGDTWPGADEIVYEDGMWKSRCVRCERMTEFFGDSADDVSDYVHYCGGSPWCLP